MTLWFIGSRPFALNDLESWSLGPLLVDDFDTLARTTKFGSKEAFITSACGALAKLRPNETGSD